MNALIRQFFVGLLLCLTPVLVTEAQAQPVVTHTFCFDYQIVFADGASGIGDELTGSETDAIGATFRIIRNSNGDVFDFIVSATTGCKTLNLKAEAWTVKLQRKANIKGNLIEIRNDQGGQLMAELAPAFVPTDNQTTTWDVSDNKNNRIMAAATFAISKRDGGMDEEYSFRPTLTNCPVGAAGCFHPSTGTINIGDAIGAYKFAIAHELGHAMAFHANQGLSANQDYQSALDDCPAGDSQPPDSSHTMPSKEMNSAAAFEGLAHAYSAVIFNDSGGPGTDCEIEKHYRPDWDSDSSLETEERAIFSCEGGVPLATPSVPDEDLYSDRCEGAGVHDNRGTEYDWLRMFWDLYTDEGLSWSTILDIYDESDPETWLNSTGTGHGYPSHNMETGAFLVGGWTVYNAFKAQALANGTSR